MKLRILLFALLAVVFVGCKNQQSKSTQAEVSEYAIVTPISLVENIAEYQDAKVEMEGLVNHVCRSGGKFKMVADNGAVITIYPKDTTEKYDASLARKVVKVYGVAANKVVEEQHACEHDHVEKNESAEGCEHENQVAAPIVIVTCDKYEVIRDVDAE